MQLLVPETDKISISGPRNSLNGSEKILGPETDKMVEFIGPETDIMAKRIYIEITGIIWESFSQQKTILGFSENTQIS